MLSSNLDLRFIPKMPDMTAPMAAAKLPMLRAWRGRMCAGGEREEKRGEGGGTWREREERDGQERR